MNGSGKQYNSKVHGEEMLAEQTRINNGHQFTFKASCI